jgi:YhcH/YjgK/YiaL family protein
MIISRFGSKEFEGISKLSPLFEKSFDRLFEMMKGEIEDGRYDVSGDDAYIAVSTYETKPINADRRFEAHRDYIDVQLLLEGREIIGFADKKDLTVTDAYRPDYELYGMINEFDRIVLEDGKFAVIYPGEAHAPGLAVGEPIKVRKAVIKIKI